MLIFTSIFVAILCGAMGGLLYHLQQSPAELESSRTRTIAWPFHRGRPDSDREPGRLYLGVFGDCLYGAAGGLFLLALMSRLVGNYVSPIFSEPSASGLQALFIAWLYLIVTALVGGFLGLRLLRLVTGSDLAQWKRQLEQQKQVMARLEELLRSTRASTLVAEALAKLQGAYYQEALRLLEQAVTMAPTDARLIGYLGYCKSFLAEERNRVAEHEHLTFDQALQDLNEAIRLVEERIDRQAGASTLSFLYYNRACVQYLKWRSQGRSPARLADEELDRLRGDIQRALRQDPGRRVWRALLSDCGLVTDRAGDGQDHTGDFRDLYQESPGFRGFIQELREAREPELEPYSHREGELTQELADSPLGAPS